MSGIGRPNTAQCKRVLPGEDAQGVEGSVVPLRRRLLAVAEQERILLLEDNPYGVFTGGDACRRSRRSTRVAA
jgi:hypothetical protein